MVEICLAREGATLFAVDDGSGVPIILLHGGLANHLACRRFAAPLADRFRIITPDVRGSGRSHFGGPLGWDLLADDVAALVRHLGVSRAVIGGISSGAAIAVRTALRHPGVVDKLIVLTPAFAGADVGLTPAQDAAMKRMDELGRRTLTDGIEALLPILDALPVEMRERARPVFLTYDPASVAATTGLLASGAHPFASARELAAIDAPVLLVPGTDPTHPREVADVYRANLRRCTVVDTLDFAAAIAEFVA